MRTNNIRMKSTYYSNRYIRRKAWPILRNFILRDRPFFVHLTLTKRCNLRCVYCKAWQETPNPNELSTSEWFEAIDVLDRLGVYTLSITGGEPLLKSGVFDIIRYAKSKGFYMRLTSNGTIDILGVTVMNTRSRKQVHPFISN